MTGRVKQVREELITEGGLNRYELKGWELTYGVVAGVTGRGDENDFGLASENATSRVLERWRTLIASQGPRFHSVVVSRQVHGTALQQYERLPNGLLVGDGLDGHLTKHGGVLLSVTVADCMPVYLLEPDSGWLALLHAGWRGVADGIVEKGILRLADLAGVSVASIVMHCGVGICGDCYEVGAEVVRSVTGETPQGPAHLDLRQEVVSRAGSVGLELISRSDHCSAHGPGDFYSHRAMGGKAGRMVAYLGRPMG